MELTQSSRIVAGNAMEKYFPLLVLWFYNSGSLQARGISVGAAPTPHDIMLYRI
ncbi:MAG: hypothetical protein HC903_07165 [Methylacidiphilales bacterium]|nr:hypothetical protein [Candidatus Methylacidiphilales bacterium]